jgi:serine/threonine protein kinase
LYWEKGERLNILTFRGFSKVMSATNLSGKAVALKRLELAKETKFPEFNLMIEVILHRKASAAPNIIQFHEAFLLINQESLAIIISMEKGIPFTRFLDGYSAAKNEIALPNVGVILKQSNAALVHIHALGIVSRDVKPENFIVADKTIKLTDFGISKSLDRDGRISGNTGTRGYAAPEARGTNKHSANADVWSLGKMGKMLVDSNVDDEFGLDGFPKIQRVLGNSCLHTFFRRALVRNWKDRANSMEIKKVFLLLFNL